MMVHGDMMAGHNRNHNKKSANESNITRNKRYTSN